jgi:hypothetical protein
MTTQMAKERRSMRMMAADASMVKSRQRSVARSVAYTHARRGHPIEYTPSARNPYRHMSPSRYFDPAVDREYHRLRVRGVDPHRARHDAYRAVWQKRAGRQARRRRNAAKPILDLRWLFKW